MFAQISSRTTISARDIFVSPSGVICIKSGDILWFWDRFTQCPAKITVFDVFDSSFSFFYQDRLFKISYAYAEGKLFSSKEGLPGYDEWKKQSDDRVAKWVEESYRRGMREVADGDVGWFKASNMRVKDPDRFEQV